MQKSLTPASIRAPFGHYSHGILIPAGAELVVTSGQLGADHQDEIPATVEAQAEICFENIKAILAEGGMTFANVVRLNAYVTRREDFPAYMAVRDRYTSTPLPASTLMIVSGFTKPEFLVEVEALAAAPLT